MPKYAEGTTTTVEASEAEIRRTLASYGVRNFAVVQSSEVGYGAIEFEFRERRLRYEVHMPPLESFRKVESRRGGFPQVRTDAQTQKAWDAERRRRWRVLLLQIKAQLNLADDESMPFEDIFLAQMILPNGATMAQAVKPWMDGKYIAGDVPRLLEDLGGRSKP